MLKLAKVVVVGGGTGGVVAANVLRKTLKKEHKVVLIDRNQNHVFYGTIPLLNINRRKPQNLQRNLSRLNNKGIDFVQAEVTGIDYELSKVLTTLEPVSYDYLVLSPGAEHHPETVPGFNEIAYNAYSLKGANQLRQNLKDFVGGKIVVFISSLPFSCPPAPYEITFLLDDYLRNRGIRNQTEIYLITPEPSPEPLAEPKVGGSIREMLNERDINYYSEAKVLSIDPLKQKLILDQGVTIPGDYFIGIPSHWGPNFLRNTFLSEEGGWIKVDPNTLQTKIKNIFAIGDATNIRLPINKVWAPKAGIFAHYQAEVVARNLSRLISRQKPNYSYTAKGM